MNGRIYIGLILLTACLAAAVRGQEPAPPAVQATPASTPQASPTAIPFSDVITQAENADSTLKEIASGASPDAATAAIEKDLPTLVDEINARLDETARTVEGSSSLDSLRSFESDWRTLTRNLPSWRNDLSARARELESDLSQLDDVISKWQKTLDELAAVEAPPEISGRIEEILLGPAEPGAHTGKEGVIALQNVSRRAERVMSPSNVGAAGSTCRPALGRAAQIFSWIANLWAGSSIVGGINASLATKRRLGIR